MSKAISITTQTDYATEEQLWASYIGKPLDQVIIYAEWFENGVFDNGIFKSWGEYYERTFSPDLTIQHVHIIK